MQSTWGCGKDPDFSTATNYNATINIIGNATFNPRCWGDRTETINSTETNVDKLVWNPYESIRSLRTYNVDVKYTIWHNNLNGTAYNCIPLHIQWPN